MAELFPKNAARGLVQTFTVPPPGTATLTFPPEFQNLEPHEQDLVKALFVEVRKGTTYPVVHGGFGDIMNCDGIVEKTIEPPEGGLLTKFWGCDYYFKGFPQKELVEGMGLAKSMMSQLPREIFAKSWFWKISFGFLAIFNRKLLIHHAKIWFGTIYGHTLLKMKINVNKYNSFVRELKRAGDEAIKKCLDKIGDKGDIPYSLAYFNLLLHHEWQSKNKRAMWELMAALLEFVYFFIEHDNAYRFRLQDILLNLDKENVRKNVIKEFKKLLDILIERENPKIGVRYKWIELRKLVIPALYVSKDLRVFVREFLLELDLEKIKPDEHDQYFMLRRDTYMFGGRLTEERLVEAERIDREKQQVRIQLQLLNDKGRQFPVVQILQLPKIEEKSSESK